MHIGLVAQGGAGWAGGSEYIRNLAHAIRTADRAAGITLFCGEPQFAEWEPHAGLFDRIVAVSVPAAQPVNPAPLRSVTTMLERLRVPGNPFAEAIRSSGVEFLYPVTYDNHYNVGMSFPLGRIGCHWAGWIPDFQHRHLPHFFTTGEIARRERDIAHLLAEAKVLVFSSESAAVDYRSFYPTGSAHVEILRFSTFPRADWYEPGSIAELGPQPERFLLVCNQFWKHKNHLTLFRALELLRERGVQPAMLCTGAIEDFRDPEYASAVRAAIERGGLAEQVRLLGVIPRRVQIELLRRCVAVVQPSFFEGWSTVVEDARVFGKPVLLSDLAVHREQNPPGAQFFPPASAEALAEVIASAWQSLPHGVQIAAEQAARAVAEAALPKVGARMLEIAVRATRMKGLSERGSRVRRRILISLAPSQPIGVVIPTRNSAEWLPAHLETVAKWADLVEEVVVVDSESADGTLDIIRSRLRHPRLRILQHPPGLYQSWNFAIGHLRSKYAYISTIGDTISPGGLEHLLDTAETFQADVVVSPPRFLDASGAERIRIQWPIHRLIEIAGIHAPRRISPLGALSATVVYMPAGLLGSSASNLYRTEVLQRFPFSTDFGHHSDTAWTLRHAMTLAWALTPNVVSDFRVHSNTTEETPDDQAAVVERYCNLLVQVSTDISASAQPRADDSASRLTWLLKMRRDNDQSKRLEKLLDQIRDRKARGIRWMLNPKAWKVRVERNRYRRLVRAHNVEIKRLLSQL